MNNKIKQLGVVNFHTYREEVFNINGNVLMFKASNGTGKTALLTALYPTLFTLDLSDSLNFGKGNNRKARDFIKNDTYIFGIFSGVKNYSIVVNYKVSDSNTRNVRKRAFILETTDLKLIHPSGESLTLSEFKKKYKDYIKKEFESQQEYQKWVAENIFQIPLPQFKTYIKAQYKIASSSTMSSGQSFKVDSLIEEIKSSLDKIKNDSNLTAIVDIYTKNIIKINEERKEIEKKTELYNALVATRLKYTRKNKEPIKEIEKTLRQMNKELVDFQVSIDLTTTAISEIEDLKEQNKIEQENKEKVKSEKDKKLAEINKQLASLDIKTQIENKQNELARIEKELIEANRNIKDNAQKIQILNNNISTTTNKINNEQNKLITIGEIIPLPFNVEDWAKIQQQYLESQKAIDIQGKIKNQMHIIEKQKEEKYEILNKVEKQILASKSQYEQAKTVYFDNCGITPKKNETIEDYKIRLLNNLNKEQVKIQLALKENTQDITMNQTELTRLQNSTKPQTHFESQNATPLFEIVDFKEYVEDADRQMIENLLKHSGLLELLVEEDNTREGIILCQENH